MRDMVAKGRDYRGVPLQGSRHGNAIINEETAIAIYYATGSASAISRAFGVARAVVRGIKGRTHWAHIQVEGPPGALIQWSRSRIDPSSVHETIKRLG